MTNEDMQALVNKAAKIINSEIIIPRGATNGDVIKTVFETEIKGEDKNLIFANLGDTVDTATFWKIWWNAPYREEDAE